MIYTLYFVVRTNTWQFMTTVDRAPHVRAGGDLFRCSFWAAAKHKEGWLSHKQGGNVHTAGALTGGKPSKVSVSTRRYRGAKQQTKHTRSNFRERTQAKKGQSRVKTRLARRLIESSPAQNGVEMIWLLFEPGVGHWFSEKRRRNPTAKKQKDS